MRLSVHVIVVAVAMERLQPGVECFRIWRRSEHPRSAIDDLEAGYTHVQQVPWASVTCLNVTYG